MSTATLTKWKPGTDLPYAIPAGDGAMLAIRLPAAWIKPDRTGQPLLLPPAVRALDRLRATLADDEVLTPGFIVSLRGAMRITQQQLARKLNVSKMTVSRWERGTMRPGASAVEAMRGLQRHAQRAGVKVDGARR
jgi:DNA-binding transcriptional regulator YiaG